jgi:hypothetical protein
MMGKFRNKKTGEIKEWDYVCALTESNPGEIYDSDEYDSIAKLCENWEDYEPVEPLIKDEKIRKAVRAWAEANGLNYVNCYESAHYWYLRAFNSREQGVDIEFWGYQLPKELTNCGSYTITELCGEEK